MDSSSFVFWGYNWHCLKPAVWFFLLHVQVCTSHVGHWIKFGEQIQMECPLKMWKSKAWRWGKMLGKEESLPWLPAWSWSFKISMSERGLCLISNSHFHCHQDFTWVPLAPYTMNSTDHYFHWKSILKLDSSCCLTPPIKLSQSSWFTFNIHEMFFSLFIYLVLIWTFFTTVSNSLFLFSLSSRLATWSHYQPRRHISLA